MASKRRLSRARTPADFGPVPRSRLRQSSRLGRVGRRLLSIGIGAVLPVVALVAAGGGMIATGVRYDAMRHAPGARVTTLYVTDIGRSCGRTRTGATSSLRLAGSRREAATPNTHH